MIRRAYAADKDRIIEYLYQEPEYNIFIIGDIEAFGMATNFQFIYADFLEDNTINSVLLIYRIHCVFYSHTNEFNPNYLSILDNHTIYHMSGKQQIMNQVAPYLHGWRKRDMFFCKAETAEPTDYQDYYELESIDDCRDLYDLTASIDEFDIKLEQREEYAQSKYHSLQMGTILGIKRKRDLICTVEATAETALSAMVIGVATKKNYRNKGHASNLMRVLMDTYINEKQKSLCLFYDNPKAGTIYKRLGFYDLGQWSVLDKEE